MGTVIDHVEVTRGRWRHRHSALHLAVTAARDCLAVARRDRDDVDLLINTGIYRDRNLAEPALAALIQQDVGANPEDPHPEGHGTFSFDVANGSCGVLTALQIADGFLRSNTIDCALVVASDADPGRGCSEDFPFSPTGAALLCHWSDDDRGLGRVHWLTSRDDGETFRATVGFADARNVLRFATSAAMDDRFASTAAEVARRCLREAALDVSDLDAIITAPARRAYRTRLAENLGVPVELIVAAGDERVHTAALLTAMARDDGRLRNGRRVLLVAAGAGVVAGAAVYSSPPSAPDQAGPTGG
ncbi:3-oxoacyl-[acyl-carrier-protein] synthase III C-terminal domain-containing protein [Mycolicibacterium sp. 050158]|uniref:3-oxoacyl-[acyl-carrier-protein] synthase III C-terminal domain-containing protein n=1 Tax=Mycolicibacterium sp. 050158 TaxID=3090602 RepID=UPI00299E09B6|nr:3-oxoacyl-[acyl-carrier-protein] synthase III C-terminal domain-containing protein [Mycolicibacterium sp. 050158]MDX1890754.1 3-oxoacyl-[acyl-carrier-protein] synthase III C-terminal domain-containing protein [Mycolicibacterium sp. 050158]